MQLGRTLMTFGTIAVVICFTTLAYLANALMERGYVGTATGTDGSATTLQTVIGIAALAGLVLGVTAVIVGLVKIIASGRNAEALESEPAA